MDLSARFTKLDYSPGNPGNPGNVLIFPQTLIHAAPARCTEINADDRIHSDCFFSTEFSIEHFAETLSLATRGD